MARGFILVYEEWLTDHLAVGEHVHDPASAHVHVHLVCAVHAKHGRSLGAAIVGA